MLGIPGEQDPISTGMIGCLRDSLTSSLVTRLVKNKPTQPNPGLVQQINLPGINTWEALLPTPRKSPPINIPLSGCVLQDALHLSTPILPVLHFFPFPELPLFLVGSGRLERKASFNYG